MDMLNRVQREAIALKNRRDHILSDIFPKITDGKVTAVHNRNYYRVDPENISQRIIFHGNLGFTVRTEKRIDSDLPGQTAAECPGKRDRKGHARFCLGARAAKHHALISSAADFIAGAQSNIRRLGMNPALNLNGICVKALARVHITDAADDLSCNGGIIHLSLRCDLSADQAKVRSDHGFTGHTGGGVLTEAFIQDGIGNGVRHLIRMTGGDAFGSKKSAGH